jgi:transcriptional regulator with XRE-family HTH domain
MVSMATDERAEQIGMLIRQLRRQRNITQAKLGATRYSKSYVSAVEKNTIRPSVEALQFFAEQLDQPRDYFTALLKHPEGMKQDTALQEPHATAGQSTQDEAFLSLRLLLERMDHSNVRALEALPPVAPELIAALAPSEQASYFFLEGVMFQEKQEYEASLHALERALPLASAQLQPAVLDALGQHYYLTRSYAIALHYHQRALTLLRHAASQEPESALLFPVTLHCGEDFRALGAYTQACDMYERARAHLHAEHEMKGAALLYLGWSYCTYALSYQAAAQVLAVRNRVPLEEMERRFQRAIGFAIQSMGVSQVSGDHLGEANARLLLAVTELDFSSGRRQLVSTIGGAFLASCLSLLDEAEEQCRQVLVSCQDTPKHRTAPHAPTIYVALAYLVRAFIQRAALARLSGHDDTALRERALAAHLCQQTLDALGEPAFPWALLQAGLSLQAERSTEDAPALPRLPELTEDAPAFRSRLLGRVEVYCAGGEVAEELGRTAPSSNDAHDCYTCADHCFDTALTLVNAIVSSQECEPGYLVRCHQRYARLLQERFTAAPEVWKETSRTLAALLTDGLFQVQNAIISAQLSLPDVAQD